MLHVSLLRLKLGRCKIRKWGEELCHASLFYFESFFRFNFTATLAPYRI